ncbi:MAG: hypothetical protein HY423_03465 [Candidatus Lambdaproteobacteria bacterium]|nr:hypothetical protein [Candidatus Lambdaproteobacteria bacterium]
MTRPPWRVLFIATATGLVLPGDAFLYGVLPTYYAVLGLAPWQVGVLLSANRWVRMGSNTLAEWVYRRPPIVPWVVASFLGGALCTLVYGTVPVFLILLAMRLVWGVCFSFMRQAGIMTVLASSERARLRQNMGYLRSFSAIGGILGVLLGGIGHDQLGFTPTLLIFAVLALAAAPLGFLSQRGLEPAPAPAHRSATALGDPRVLAGGFALGMVGPGLVTSGLGLVLKAQLGGTVSLLGLTVGVASLNGFLLAFRWILDGLGSPTLGALADRMGRERLIPWVFGVGALALLLAFLPTGIPGIVAGVLVLFVCNAFLLVLLQSWAGLHGPRTVSGYVTAQDLGSALGPVVGLGFAQFGLSPKLIFLTGAVLYGLCVAASRRVGEEA